MIMTMSIALQVHGKFTCKLEYDHGKNAMVINGNLVYLIYSNGPEEVM